MVHISLPHRISHRGKNGAHQEEGSRQSSRRTSPSRGLSTGSTTSSLGALEKPLVLKVYVIKGRNLAPKDRSGTSDPYLVVNLGNDKQSTPAISKTLNPEWKICFDMPLVDVPLLECVCWDKDRFKKDYMGEFDIAVEDIFPNGQIHSDEKWYKLKSKRKEGKRKNEVSGDVQMKFSLIDSANPAASPEDIYKKFRSLIKLVDDDDEILSRSSTMEEEMDDESDDEPETGTDVEMMARKPTIAEKKEKKKRLARLRKKSIAVRNFEIAGGAQDVSGIIFMEIVKAVDLPPEKNMTRTSFDCDPFVVAALGRKVLRTKVVRHNLNPIWHEKMIYQVMKHETGYSLTFTVIDKDKLSGNDFIASTSFPVSKLIAQSPDRDPQTGLYDLPEPPEYSPAAQKKEKKSRFRLPLSRSASATSLSRLARPGVRREASQLSIRSGEFNTEPAKLAPTSMPADNNGNGNGNGHGDGHGEEEGTIDGEALDTWEIPLELKYKDRWEAKHSPQLQFRAKFLPYLALRQQFWRAMLKQYDADDSQRISKIELTTMLDTLGSTLKESTIDGFFKRFSNENQDHRDNDLSFDQVVICLEEQLEKVQTQKKSLAERAKDLVHSTTTSSSPGTLTPTISDQGAPNPDVAPPIATLSRQNSSHLSEHGNSITDLSDESSGEEHVIEIRECPICHQPKLHKRTDAEIVLHIATCASSDWRQVNNLVMGGFVTQSQAQRKWYSKVITKISYGGYKLGANSANILVQDRITGQINEERMSVYVRLGIRLLYKAIGSREMERGRIKKMLKSLSVKQGKKYDDPASVSQIEGFIQFHQLDMSEVLFPTSDFRNFNEFFFRALKPDARPCSAPDRPEIIVSPADCRSVVFNTIDEATRIWVKGRDYSLERLFGDAYPLDAKRYKGGSMGIFRLAPQDYHRFHIPVDGILGTPKPIDGEYYTVNPMAIRSALDVYGENIRVVIPIDSVAHGRVMFVCIGAMMVGSTIITRKAGERVRRAEELGYFKFGGSTILLFFEPGKMVYDSDLVENSTGALETLVRVGMSIGHSPDADPYRPDMKKDESEVTEREKAEAKRRIGGSLAPEREMEDEHRPVDLGMGGQGSRRG